MNGPQFLTDANLAGYYLQAGNTARPGESAVDIEPRVEAWLSRANMAHRRAWPIALEVTRLVHEPAPVASPEQAAWQDNRAQGIGNQQPLTADQIAAMDMAAFAELRARLGIGAAKDQGIFAPIRNG